MVNTAVRVISEDVARYLVVGLPRSGTTLVHTAIMGHPAVSALSDEMQVCPFFERGLSSFTYGHEFDEEKRCGHRVLFDAMTSIMATDRTTAMGAKCCAQTVEQAHVLVGAMRSHFPDMKVVLTIRKDLVAQYGSLRSARATQAWHSWNAGIDKNRQKKVHINRFLFTRYALRCLESMQVLRQLHESHDVFECDYEKLLVSRDTVFEEIFRFLGLKPVNITWLKAEKVKPPPDQYIKNYAQMSDLTRRLCLQHEQGRVPRHARATSGTIERASRWYYRYVVGKA